MNILFLTQLLPYPLDTGGKVKTFKILKILSLDHVIHLVSLVDKKEDLYGESILKKFCKEITTFVVPVITKKHKNLFFKIVASLFTNKPFIVYKFYSPKIVDYINSLLKEKKFDLIYIDHITMAQYIPNWYHGKIVYDEHNISYLAYKRYTKLENNIFKKLFFSFESYKLKQFEKKWLPKFSHIFTISNIDKQRIIELGINSSKISFLPVPFIISNIYHGNINPSAILFLGMLSWRPNEKGILWFIKNVFPIIKENIPKVNLIIAGKNGEVIQRCINKFGDVNIKYLGFVKNISSLYRKAAVFIAPILMGSGIRIKLLDALSHGVPVVSTTIGVEGIEVENKKELLIADTPENFAGCVIRIIKDNNLARKLSINSLKFIEGNYNQNQAENVLNILNKI